MTKRRWVICIMMVIVLGSITVGCASSADSGVEKGELYASDPAGNTGVVPGDAAHGRRLFKERGCQTCHTIGGGVLVGPDLRGVTRRYSYAYLQRWLHNPTIIYRERGGGPVNRGFPRMGRIYLSDDEIRDLLAFLYRVDRATGQ